MIEPIVDDFARKSFANGIITLSILGLVAALGKPREAENCAQLCALPESDAAAVFHLLKAKRGLKTYYRLRSCYLSFSCFIGKIVNLNQFGVFAAF